MQKGPTTTRNEPLASQAAQWPHCFSFHSVDSDVVDSAQVCLSDVKGKHASFFRIRSVVASCITFKVAS